MDQCDEYEIYQFLVMDKGIDQKEADTIAKTIVQQNNLEIEDEKY